MPTIKTAGKIIRSAASVQDIDGWFTGLFIKQKVSLFIFPVILLLRMKSCLIVCFNCFFSLFRCEREDKKEEFRQARLLVSDLRKLLDFISFWGGKNQRAEDCKDKLNNTFSKYVKFLHSDYSDGEILTWSYIWVS